MPEEETEPIIRRDRLVRDMAVILCDYLIARQADSLPGQVRVYLQREAGNGISQVHACIGPEIYLADGKLVKETCIGRITDT